MYIILNAGKWDMQLGIQKRSGGILLSWHMLSAIYSGNHRCQPEMKWKHFRRIYSMVNHFSDESNTEHTCLKLAPNHRQIARVQNRVGCKTGLLIDWRLKYNLMLADCWNRPLKCVVVADSALPDTPDETITQCKNTVYQKKQERKIMDQKMWLLFSGKMFYVWK